MEHKTLPELKALCKERGIRGFSTKRKADLVALLEGLHISPTSPTVPRLVSMPVMSMPVVPSGTRHALSLFSGAGGDTVGLEMAGWTVSHFSEFNNPAIQTHRAAFPHSELLTSSGSGGGSTDIKQIPDDVFAALRGVVDMIFAGFPCQGFSHAGKKRTDDPRNELVHEFVRATRLIQPTWIIGENVKGLLSRKGVYPPKTPPRPVIEIIRELFAEIGYRLTYRVIDTVEVGVPQHRKRLIIVGHRCSAGEVGEGGAGGGVGAVEEGDVVAGGEYPHLDWSAMRTYSPVGMDIAPTIRRLLTSTLVGAVEMRRGAPYNPETQDPRFWIHTDETTPTGTPHPNLVRLMAGQRNLSTKEKTELKRDTSEKIPFVEETGLISFGTRASSYHGQVLDPDAASKTIICAYSQCPRLFVGLHNPTTGGYWIRCLTTTEAGGIQGFAVDYPWQGTEKDRIVQIGNAVPPPLAATVARLIETATFQDVPQYELGNDSVSDDSDEE